jgi:hypothetical protein
VLDLIAARSENATLLMRLRASAEPARSEYRLGEWELHAHPDLCERLDEVAREGHRIELYGCPGRSSRLGVVYALAAGIDTILLRLPAGRARDAVLDNEGSIATEYGPNWVAANAWLTEIPRTDGTALLTQWLDTARRAGDA